MKQQQPFVLCVVVLLWGLSIAFSTTPTSNSAAVNSNMESPSAKRRRRVLLEATSDGITSENGNGNTRQAGKLEALKQLEAELAAQLAMVRREKLAAIRSRPLTIGVVGFGRFGQFIAKTFAKYGNVVVTSRSDYTDIAETMGAKYVPLSDPEAFLAKGLDVIVVAVSILSFDSTIRMLAPYLKREIQRQQDKLQQKNSTAAAISTPLHGPLIVDVLSVKEHARNIMLEYLPVECDILCTHPMFGPDSGKNGWFNLNFVYEKTRIHKVLLDPKESGILTGSEEAFLDESGGIHSVHEDSEAHVEGMDRMERFLSIWEEEGCRMVPLSCREHDAYAANSQFITHLVGRVLGSQGLSQTPIDTSGFQSVLKLVDSTTADSFDLFYGLYKYNQNSLETIKQLQAAMDDVVQNLQTKENEEKEARGETK
jgi:arogenate dehydrogenase (NADP+), plant